MTREGDMLLYGEISCKRPQSSAVGSIPRDQIMCIRNLIENITQGSQHILNALRLPQNSYCDDDLTLWWQFQGLFKLTLNRLVNVLKAGNIDAIVQGDNFLIP